MAFLPATQFGCGFTVTCGVKFVLISNLVLNVSIVAMSIGYLVFGITGMALGAFWAEALMLSIALAGLPIIIMAFHGVIYRNEAQIRLYLYYMWLLIVVAVILVVKNFVLSSACADLAGMFQQTGSAWACGMARYVAIGSTLVSLSLLLYFQHVVYSHCEDLAECGGGPDLGDLMLNKEAYSKRWQPDNAYSSIEGMANLSDSGGMWETAIMGASVYDGQPSGLGGGAKIFGGYHDMSYNA